MSEPPLAGIQRLSHYTSAGNEIKEVGDLNEDQGPLLACYLRL